MDVKQKGLAVPADALESLAMAEFGVCEMTPEEADALSGYIVALQAQAAALTAELEAVRRDAEKWRAWKASQDRIEKELPEGYAIELWCSPGDWSISLRDPEGKDIEIVDFDDVDDFIRRAIEVARQTVALVPVKEG